MHRTLIPVDEMPLPVVVGNRYVFADGTTLPVVAGGSGEETPPTGAGDPPPAPPTPPAASTPPPATPPTPAAPSAPSFTSADVEAYVAAQLGVSLKDAKKVITDQKAAADAAKTETQRAIDAAAERERVANEAQAAAAVEMRSARAERALMAVGVNGERLARATILLLAETPADADPAAMTTAATKLKAEMPELFGVARAPGSDPAGRAPGAGGNDGPTGIEAGRTRAATAHADASKTNRNPFEGLSLIGGSAGGNHS